MTDPQLMAAIHSKYGSWINQASAGTRFPPALLAALTANESGLDEGAARFEPGVYESLSFVVIGKRPEYEGIGALDLTKYLENLTPAATVLSMVNLATSWGPTQVMGWQALKRGYPIAELTNLETHYLRAVDILRDTAKEFPAIVAPAGVQVAPGGWQAWFHCWNAGNPTGKTFDPNYPANGVRRLALYEALA